jgi:hypothetical protein
MPRQFSAADRKKASQINAKRWNVIKKLVDRFQRASKGAIRKASINAQEINQYVFHEMKAMRGLIRHILLDRPDWEEKVLALPGWQRLLDARQNTHHDVPDDEMDEVTRDEIEEKRRNGRPTAYERGQNLARHSPMPRMRADKLDDIDALVESVKLIRRIGDRNRAEKVFEAALRASDVLESE